MDENDFSFGEDISDPSPGEKASNDAEKWSERKRNLRTSQVNGEEKPKRKYSRKKSPQSEPRPEYKPNEASIKMCATLGNVMWEFSRLLHGRRSLTEKETLKFGAALDPVLYKYLPILNDWAVEMNLIGTTFELWQATEPTEEEIAMANGAVSSDSSATVLP